MLSSGSVAQVEMSTEKPPWGTVCRDRSVSTMAAGQVVGAVTALVKEPTTRVPGEPTAQWTQPPLLHTRTAAVMVPAGGIEPWSNRSRDFRFP